MCLSIQVQSPERVLAEGEHLGFKWVVTHNNMAYRCGYIQVPQGHPWHGVDSMSLDVDVHGGLTFSEQDMECDEPGEDNAWWLGFDCGHSHDLQDPNLPTEISMPTYSWTDATVKTQEFVENECRKLCEQAKIVCQN